MDILTVAQFLEPFFLWNDKLYGKLIKSSTFLSLLFVILLVVIFFEFLTKYLWVLIILLTIFFLISNFKLMYVTLFLFPFLLLPLLETMPIEISSYFILVGIWVGYYLAQSLTIHQWRGANIAVIPLLFCSPLLLVVTITILFKMFPFVIDLLLYQNLLSKAVGSSILFWIYFTVFLLSPVLVILLYRAFDITLMRKIPSNITRDFPRSKSYFQGFTLFLLLVIGMAPALLTRVISVGLGREDVKIFRGKFISKEAAILCVEHIKTQLIYCVKQGTSQFLEYTGSFAFHIIQINLESIERVSVNFSASFIGVRFLPRIVIQGNGETVNGISKFFEKEGSIFIEKGHTELCIGLENKLFLEHKVVIHCKSKDCIWELKTVRDEIRKIKEKKSQLSYLEREYIDEKISCLEKELFLREYLIQNEWDEQLWEEYEHVLNLFLSKIEIRLDNTKTYDSNTVNQFFRLREKLIQFRDLSNTDEKTMGNLSVIKESINSQRNIKYGLGIAHHCRIKWENPFMRDD